MFREHCYKYERKTVTKKKGDQRRSKCGAVQKGINNKLRQLKEK